MARIILLLLVLSFVFIGCSKESKQQTAGTNKESSNRGKRQPVVTNTMKAPELGSKRDEVMNWAKANYDTTTLAYDQAQIGISEYQESQSKDEVEPIRRKYGFSAEGELISMNVHHTFPNIDSWGPFVEKSVIFLLNVYGEDHESREDWGFSFTDGATRSDLRIVRDPEINPDRKGWWTVDETLTRIGRRTK